jgi:hypothetical protein
VNDALIIPLIALALLTTVVYYRGGKKNRWISSWISKEAEEALKPADTDYTNYGGNIGYNFVYKMSKPFREAKGTFTLLPRHSAFFIPISMLFFSRHDKYYLNLYADGKLAGEGHIIAKSYFSKASRMILGMGRLRQEEAVFNEKRYILLWDGKGMDEKLKKFVSKLEHPELLLHFCCYSENKNFFLYVKPLRFKLGELLKSYMPELKPFFLKGGYPNDESGNAEED